MRYLWALLIMLSGSIAIVGGMCFLVFIVVIVEDLFNRAKIGRTVNRVLSNIMQILLLIIPLILIYLGILEILP